MKSLRFALIAVALVSATTASAAAGKGEGLYGIQITNGTADLYSGAGAGTYITAYDHSELGVGLQYWRLMSSDYAFNFSAGIGTFTETDKPGVNATAGAKEGKYSQSSWSVRVGGDRAEKIGDRAVIYFGPGIEYWSGKSKFTDIAGVVGTLESENTTRISLSGRVGGVMMFNDKVGFNCQVGRYVGMASATDKGAKVNWWPSGFQASGGLVLRGK